MKNTSKHLKHALSVLSIAACLAACGAWEPGADTEGEEADEMTESKQEATFSDVEEKMTEAGEAIQAYAYDQKDEFEEWARGRLDDLDREMKRLDERIDAAGETTEEQWSSTMENLKEARSDLNDKLDAAMTSSEDAWLDLREGFSEAQDVVADSLEEAWNELASDADSREASSS